MNRYSFASPAEPRAYPLFCLQCDNLSDHVNKSGLCLKHILESRIKKDITIKFDQDTPKTKMTWFNWS